MPADYFLELTRVRTSPVDTPWEDGVPVAGGVARPFVLERAWSGPAGSYVEEWLIRSEGRVVHRSPPRHIFVRGMQSATEQRDLIAGGFRMDPGSYEIVFIVEGYLMGAGAIEARTVEEQAA